MRVYKIRAHSKLHRTHTHTQSGGQLDGQMYMEHIILINGASTLSREYYKYRKYSPVSVK